MKTPHFFYISSADKYMTPYGELYTDEQIDNFEKLKRDWENNQQHYTFQKLMGIFPEAVKPARRGMKVKIKHYKTLLSKANEDQEKEYNEVIIKAHFKEQARMQERSEEYYNELREGIERKLKKHMFRLSYLDELEGKIKPRKMGGVNETDVARAKEVPIENFYEGKLKTHGKRATGPCPWHKDKTPSLTIYLDQNSFFCYSCSAGGSVIDFVIKQNEVDFLTAIKTILK